jgi:hypothetical protein
VASEIISLLGNPTTFYTVCTAERGQKGLTSKLQMREATVTVLGKGAGWIGTQLGITSSDELLMNSCIAVGAPFPSSLLEFFPVLQRSERASISGR